ncbi:hypothetical protein ASPCAL12892 [Aspergillus calidoustus]|uniref:Uncharacterized protein n=1 Tax=Aspergillus calidoustus TaxID=454130 RepID=A0A0U5GBR3_ASPCI|nr:hypothetical protein ASPCAL12892 [Aspergillus calidoustus]
MTSLLRGSAFITGAASGIGKATATSFATHGIHQLAIADINLPLAQEAARSLESRFPNLQVLPIHLDVSSEESIAAAIAQTRAEFTRIDYAVNNAGISGSPTLSAEHDASEWRKTLDVNLTGVWMCSRAQIGAMLSQEKRPDDSERHNRGVIVNVASMYGLLATSLNTPAVAYTASKHGVVGLTRADAIAYAEKGIRINAVCPGYVATPLLEGRMESGVVQREIAKIPVGRMASPEEIGDQIVVLASTLCSYVYGAAVVADGGFTIQ